MADINKSRGLDEGKTKDLMVTIKADVDVSGALTGLKAVQREAKAAVKALRELELVVSVDDKVAPDYVEFTNAQGSIGEYDLSDVPTAELSRALAKREGVEEYIVAPHGDIANLYLADRESGGYVIIEGPARILVNKD